MALFRKRGGSDCCLRIFSGCLLVIADLSESHPVGRTTLIVVVCFGAHLVDDV